MNKPGQKRLRVTESQTLQVYNLFISYT